MLPQELVDMVIDLLYDNRQMLRNCSLVCRSWLDRSRLHKFDTVHERYTFAFPGQAKNIYSRPAAAPFIRNLILYNCIPCYISLCTNITYIEVKSVEFTDDMRPLDVPSLTSLQLSQCAFGTTGLLYRLLSSFPRLSSLGLRDVFYRYATDNAQNLEYSLSRSSPFTGELTMIDTQYNLGNSTLPSHLYTLLSFIGGVHFSSICVTYRPCDIVPELNMLLESCGSSLERLDLRDCVIHDVIRGSRAINLSYNTRLGELKLPTARSMHTEPLKSPEAEWQCAVLSSIPASSVHTVHVDAASWIADLLKSTLKVPNVIIKVLEEV